MRKSDPGNEQSELLTIRTFGDELEAGLAESALAAAGIEYTIARDDCGGLRPSLTFSNGLKLKVRSEDARRATQILSETFGKSGPDPEPRSNSH